MESYILSNRLFTNGAGSMKVLIIEDNPDTAEAFGLLISQCGHETRIAHDASTAVALSKEWSPEVVFLDIGLPEMDGYLLANLLRTEGLTKAKIVALSGYRPDENRLSSLDIDAYLLKPVRLEVLLKHLETSPSSA